MRLDFQNNFPLPAEKDELKEKEEEEEEEDFKAGLREKKGREDTRRRRKIRPKANTLPSNCSVAAFFYLLQL